MSGDVQPRKRKDRKRKKDELAVEEPRGTAAALGEGDVFMHSYQDHGTGGHWCAKVIFFALLAVLMTLIGLIILENRGLSELEANSVESRYSGVLEGWLEDAPSDNHHDEHTLELKHHDDDDEHDDVDIEGNGQENESDEANELEHSKEDENEIDSEMKDEDEVEEEYFSQTYGEDQLSYDQDDSNHEEDAEHDDREEDDEHDDREEDDEHADREEDDDHDEDGDHHDEEYFGVKENENEENDSIEKETEDETINYENSYNNEDERDLKSNEQDDDDFDVEKFTSDMPSFEVDNADAKDNEDDDDHEDEDDDEHEEEEIESIEREVSEEEPLSLELPVLPEKDDDDDDNNKEDDDVDGKTDNSKEDDNAKEDDGSDLEDEFLEPDDDDDDGVPIEKITAPSGQPFDEIEDEVSSVKPTNTLEEEEEYEKRQEELRREEEQQSSSMWMKLVIGGALLVATQAVVRRFTSARGDEDDEDDQETREETPTIVDRRMTILLDEPPVRELSKKSSLELSAPVSQELFRKTPLIIKSAPTPKQVSIEEEEVEEQEVEEKSDEEKELYSDDEEAIEEEEEIPQKVEAKKEVPQKEVPKQSAPPPKEAKKVVIIDAAEEGEDEDVDDDVEIIDEEDVEEEEEEDVSDVDDTELLSRLEAKYGRLPEPERPGQRHKDGGNTMEDYWPEEPSNPHWHQQLEEAERELLQGRYEAALVQARQAELHRSARARWIVAQALDRMAEAKRDNRVLSQAIAAYLELLKMNEKLPDKKLLQITERTLNRMQFRGVYLSMEPVYKLLIRRFPNDVSYRNKLTVSLLMANRADLAETVLKETLQKWPRDKVALAHYGFVLKTQHKKYEQAVEAFQVALEGDEGAACEPRFYYHYGDALLLLGRFAEAHEVHKRATTHGHFLSPTQRSLYNVPRLKSRPWWKVEQTPYAKLARSLETSWKSILKEGQALRALYEEEKEGLRERGEWSQLDLFVRGQEIPGRCDRAPITCSIIRAEVGASGCRRGQIKFSLMEAGTHVRPHVGPTNCRLRMHLGLSNTKDTFIRVDKEIRQWQEGKVLLFDDSFEHEVWHNGTGSRLVLIVDVWHPDLTQAERRQLPAI